MLFAPRSEIHRTSTPFIALLVVLTFAAMPSTVRAQVLYGSLVGNVTDNTGAALPGATVTITHAQTNTTREMVTDGTGTYRFTTLQPGQYSVSVAMPGFANATRSDVQVTLNTVTRVDVSLQLGQLAETVTVEATTQLLQTDRAEVRAQLDSRELTNLPVPIGRNYQRLFKVIPGFTPPSDAHSVPSNPSRALTFNVNGASQSTNNTRIDGVSTTNIWLPHVAAYVPALESLETVNVVTNSFDAEQGLAGGAAINVQIKSGTNDLRGSAFEYYTNEQLRANNYFAPPGTPKGNWEYHQFGGTIGGPIRRNKLFYFVSYESTRDTQNVSRTISVPTEALRRGDLSASVNPIYDPATGNADGSGRTPFPNNQIPANRIDPLAAKMANLLPLPNLPGEQNNFFIQAPFIFNRWTIDSKVNWNATPKLNFFGRYSLLDFMQDNETVFGDLMQGQPIGGGNPGIGQGKTHSFSAGTTYSMSSNLVLDAHIGWVRMNTGVEHTDIAENKGLEFLGIPGTNGRRPFEGGMPRFNVSGYAVWGVTETYMPYYRSDDQIQNVVNLNWLKGSHNIRFGTDIYYQAMNHTQPEFIGDSMGARGGFDFGGGPTQVRGGPSGTNFNNWATYLLGLPTRVGRLNEVVAPYTTRNWHYSLYARDQWQASQKLTVSYGTRWEYFPIPTRKDRGLERYNWRTNMMEIGGVGSVPTDLGVKVSKTMFAPRVGVAYRVTPETVLRAGYGLTNDPYALARPMRTNHPILLNLMEDAPHPFAWVRPLAQGISPVPDADFGNGIIAVPGNVSVVTLPDEFDRGYIHSWNAALQRELFWGFVGEAAYVATRQVNQLGFRELNWSPIGGGQAGRQLNTPEFRRTAQTRLVAPIGNTNYHSLQTRFERRFADGYQLGVFYTFSRAKGIAGAPNSDGTPRIQIPEFYHLNYGISDIDRPHSFHLTNITQLPFGSGRRWLNNGGITSAILGGWQVNNLISFFSGTPFNVTASGTSLNAPESQQRADLVGTPRILGGTGRGNSYFDPMAFRPVTEARFGTAPWNVLRGPGFWSWDFGLFRELTFFNEKTLQLRFEAFNMLNNPRFNNPGGNVSNLQLNPDGSIRNLNGFTEITGTVDNSERQMRFGLRFGF